MCNAGGKHNIYIIIIIIILYIIYRKYVASRTTRLARSRSPITRRMQELVASEYYVNASIGCERRVSARAISPRTQENRRWQGDFVGDL